MVMVPGGRLRRGHVPPTPPRWWPASSSTTWSTWLCSLHPPVTPAAARRSGMLLATFAVSVTYLAGLSAPGGFWDDQGDAVLKGGLHDTRLKAFFVCNTTAFVASLLILVLLLEKKLRYSPKVRSFELYGFIVVSLVGLVAAYSAGSSREVDTTIYVRQLPDRSRAGLHADAAGDYPCGDRPLPGRPGAARRSVAESDGGGHAAGDPVMHDNRRPRYLAFFYSNSTSFVASIVVIILLLPEPLQKEKWWLGVMNAAVVLDLLGLLVAYAAGSGRSWRTSAKVSALVVAVLAYFVIHVVLSCFSRRGIHLRLIPVNAG